MSILSEESQKRFQDQYKKTFGKKSTGKFQHYCLDWDFMTIDENVPEFDCCTCFSDSEHSEEVVLLKEKYQQ